MRILLLSQSRNRANGRLVTTRKEVDSDWVRVGRNASSEIHLADPRIALDHALIVDRDGPTYLEMEAGALAGAQRANYKSERLTPGKTIEIGPYRLVVDTAPEGFDCALRVEMAQASDTAAPEFLQRARQLSLRSIGLRKRTVAMGLMVIIAIGAFFLPAAKVFEWPWVEGAKLLSLTDRLWNPGPVMLAHQPVGMKCEACHDVAFQQVRDASCLECHANIGQHIGPDLKPAALFEGQRCASCHRDHKGTKPTHKDDDRLCVDCHRDIEAHAKQKVASQNVSDFAKDHPRFRLSLPRAQGVQRVREGSGPLEEFSNLNFPHATHLDPKGIKHPTKDKRVVLDCDACHRPDVSKRTFEPIAMAKHCSECHNLAFEPAVTTRQVPHGSAADAVAAVREFYSDLALTGTRDSFQAAFAMPGEGLLRRPGQPTAEAREAALRVARAKSDKVTRELFERRVCKECHVVRRADTEKGPEWEIAKVRINHTWMPGARFSHASHATEKCSSCHDVEKSKTSRDVAMPKIDRCQECHGGSHPEMNKVTSNCLLCHGFHVDQHPWDPAFKPKTGKRFTASAEGS